MTTTETQAPAVKVGDFFSASWGYDQTNVTWFKVVGLSASGKSVKVQEWQGGGTPGSEPVSRREWNDDFTEQTYGPAPVQTKRLRVGGYKGASFHWKSFANAYLWDGSEQYVTPAGFGH